MNYTNIQSAENCKGFSETIRQLSNLRNQDDQFFNGYLDFFYGAGNFYLKKFKF